MDLLDEVLIDHGPCQGSLSMGTACGETIVADQFVREMNLMQQHKQGKQHALLQVTTLLMHTVFIPFSVLFPVHAATSDDILYLCATVLCGS